LGLARIRAANDDVFMNPRAVIVTSILSSVSWICLSASGAQLEPPR